MLHHVAEDRMLIDRVALEIPAADLGRPGVVEVGEDRASSRRVGRDGQREDDPEPEAISDGLWERIEQLPRSAHFREHDESGEGVEVGRLGAGAREQFTPDHLEDHGAVGGAQRTEGAPVPGKKNADLAFGDRRVVFGPGVHYASVCPLHHRSVTPAKRIRLRPGSGTPTVRASWSCRQPRPASRRCRDRANAHGAGRDRR